MRQRNTRSILACGAVGLALPIAGWGSGSKSSSADASFVAALNA